MTEWAREMKTKTLLHTFAVVAALAVPAWAAPAMRSGPPLLDITSPLVSPPQLFFSEASLVGNAESMALVSGLYQDNIDGATNKTGSSGLGTNVGGAEAAQPAGTAKVIRLAGPPAALLMVLQGILCIAFVRGRRKWALVAVAMISFGRAGLNALPRLFDAARPSNRPVATQPAVNLGGQRLASEAHTPDLDFIGLLRRMESEPFDVTIRTTSLRRIVSTLTPVAVRPTEQRLTVGFSVPSALPSHIPDNLAGDNDALCGFVPRENKCPFPLQPIPHSLFARPPPAISA